LSHPELLRALTSFGTISALHPLTTQIGSGNEVALITNKLLQKNAEISATKVLATPMLIFLSP
jgi:hypothetical protein